MPRKMTKKYPVHGEMLTAREVSQKYNICIDHVYKAASKGTLDGIGVPGAKPNPVRCRGIDFISQDACARHNNVKHGRVWQALEEGRIDYIGRRNNPNYEAELEAYSKTDEFKQKYGDVTNFYRDKRWSF